METKLTFKNQSPTHEKLTKAPDTLPRQEGQERWCKFQFFLMWLQFVWLTYPKDSCHLVFLNNLFYSFGTIKIVREHASTATPFTHQRKGEGREKNKDNQVVTKQDTNKEKDK